MCFSNKHIAVCKSQFCLTNIFFLLSKASPGLLKVNKENCCVRFVYMPYAFYDMQTVSEL